MEPEVPQAARGIRRTIRVSLRNDGSIGAAPPVRTVGECEDTSASLVADVDHPGSCCSGNLSNDVGRHNGEGNGGIAPHLALNPVHARGEPTGLTGGEASACSKVFCCHDSEYTPPWSTARLMGITAVMLGGLGWALLEVTKL
jgi:hypothetical protein